MNNNGLVYTSDNCIGCNKCIKGCPVIGSNIAEVTDKGARIVVDGEKCIHCGKCIKNCEHGARHYRDDMFDLTEALRKGEDIDLLIAPSFFFNYETNAHNIIGFLRTMGFSHIYNISFGANITTWAYIKYLKETGRIGMISSACPTVVDYVEKFMPELIDYLMPIQSPVHCFRTYLEKKVNHPGKKYAFLCPCLGKHDEYSSFPDGSKIDYTITYTKCMQYLSDNHIDVNNFYGDCDEIKRPALGAFYPIPGGLKTNMRMFINDDAYIKQIEGQNDVYPFLKSYANRIRRNGECPFFVDILNCAGGCTEGVASTRTFDDVEDLTLKLYNSKRSETLCYPGSPFDLSLSPDERFAKLDATFSDCGLEYTDFSRSFNRDSTLGKESLSPEIIEAMFKKLRKNTPESRNINCTSCGYSCCHDMAIAIAHGYNKPENCVHYVRDMLEKERTSLENLLGQMYVGQGGVLDPQNLDSEYIVEMLSKSIDEIERAKEQAFNDVQSKSQFFASMTHELRTPLNAILNMTDSFKETLPENINSTELDNIKSAGISLLDTINELLDMSKLETGNFTIIEADYQIMPLVNDVANIIRFRVAESKLHFTLLADPSLPATLIGDAKRIRQILINLLGNAVKYTRKGDVSLRITWDKDEKHPTIIFDVIDTGIGIKEEDIPFLFNAYQQVDEAKNHHIEGTGLGLSIVKALVEQMGAEITVNSVYGQGSTFTVSLPQRITKYVPVSATKFNPIEKDIQSTFTKYSMPRVNILIVDDMSVNQRVTSTFLEKYQATISFASSGPEALEMCAKENYDLILLDYQMPGMNGIEVLEKLRVCKYPSSNAAVLIMSAEDENTLEKFMKDNLLQGYLTKPISREPLEKALLKVLPPEKIVTVKDDILPPQGAFTADVQAEDYEKYLDDACIVERVARAKRESQILHMAISHRYAVQTKNYVFVDGNASFMDAQLEILRNV